MNKGIKNCPACGEQSTVTDSRPRADGKWKRRRKCQRCARCWTTVEVYEDEILSRAQVARARAGLLVMENAITRLRAMLNDLWADAR